MTIAKALENKEHLIALGQTDVYIYDDKANFPYDRVTRVKAGSTYRLSGPTGCYLYAEQEGLTFRMSFDFEGRDANGRGVSLFDRDELRSLIGKIPSAAREKFSDMMEKQVLPEMEKRSAEIRTALGLQLDSEDCVRGLIAFGKASS